MSNVRVIDTEGAHGPDQGIRRPRCGSAAERRDDAPRPADVNPADHALAIALAMAERGGCEYGRMIKPTPVVRDAIADNRGPSWMHAEWGHAQKERL